MSSSNATKQTGFFFGYGSNLWLEQMHLRCPSSNYEGVGRLANYKWFINGRGYANIVFTGSFKDVVYGLIYKLTAADEAQLDVNEGVPYAYTKETMTADFWPSTVGEKVDVKQPAERQEMLVYIDQKKIEDAKPRDEYVHRMNKGIADAILMGVPESYVEQAMRPFISAHASKEAEDVAKKQAAMFEDEEP